MHKYLKIDEVSRGSHGVVYKAWNLIDRQIVTIKKLNDCSNTSEINSLIDLNDHPNIVKLKDVVNRKNNVFLELEFMECSLYNQIVNQTKPFYESEIRDICFQLFQGLAYMHHKGFIHQDLKPSNILVSNNVIKIGDFGVSNNVITKRAYRAPEMLLRSPVYDTAVDMWAMGAIMSELFTLTPLFHGSSKPNVMHNICNVLGTPTEATWPGGIDLARRIAYRFPDSFGCQFSSLLPNASPDAVNLIAALLSWDPSMRPTAMDALQHPFFDGCYIVSPSIRHESPLVTQSVIRAPILFKMAMERELLKEEACLRSYKDDLERFEGSYEDMISMLPEHLFDYEMENTSLNSCKTDLEGMQDSKQDQMHMFVNKEEYKFRSTKRFPWSGLTNAWVAIFYRYMLLMQQ